MTTLLYYPKQVRRSYAPQQHVTAKVSQYPLVNVRELNERFILELAAPGLSKETFSVTVKENKLHIKAAFTQTTEEGVKVHRNELADYSFDRVFTLGETIDQHAVEAEYVQGVLRVTLPKRPETAPKTIAVQ